MVTTARWLAMHRRHTLTPSSRWCSRQPTLLRVSGCRYQLFRVVRTRFLTSTSTTKSSSSVSRREVDKFSEMDSLWWDPKHNPLIYMNVVRMKYISDQLIKAGLMSVRPEQRPLLALDVGCGGGLLSESLARLLGRSNGSTTDGNMDSFDETAKIVGLDPSPRLIAAAQSHAKLDPKTSHIEYHNTTVEEYALQHGNESKFDVVCLLEVLEHVQDVDSLVESASTLLRPGGQLFVSTLNRMMKSYLLTIVGAEHLMRYLPVGTHNWNQYKSPDEVQLFMHRHGLEEVNVNGMIATSVPPFGWKWKLDPNDTDVNWIGTYRKMNR